ncbi:unnamed protein product [Symbiodinium sp. CCMP2592]|nr:unnamed protein product [Symbiodinium sp. CCMP2592]
MEMSEPRLPAASATVDDESGDMSNPFSLLDDHAEGRALSEGSPDVSDWDSWLLEQYSKDHVSSDHTHEPSEACAEPETQSNPDREPAAGDRVVQVPSLSSQAAPSGEPYNRAGYECILQSSFQSLEQQVPKFFWQEGFWADVFGPKAPLVKVPSFHRFEQPAGTIAPQDSVPGSSGSKRARRLAPCIFEKVVVNMRVISWRDQREADLIRALSKWCLVFEAWDVSRTNVADQLLKCESTDACHELLSDYLAKKAPSTCLKRANSMLRLNKYVASEGFQMPTSEPDLYQLLRRGKSGGASLSELQSIMEAVTFVRFVFDVECLQSCARSKRCWGLSTAKKASLVSRADPMRVADLVELHRVLSDEEGSLWDRLMAGSALYCVYARCRWSDAQHIDMLVLEAGETLFTEFGSAVIDIHKTMHFASRAPRSMELVAVGRGLDGSDWLATFVSVRKLLGCSYEDGFPTMPAPNKQGLPTVRALSSSEAGAWLRELLPSREGMRTTSHSLKSSLLSFAAKRGIPHLDRLALGGHSHSARMSDVYARDALARPLRLLAGMISEIRGGSFVPDAGRAARFPGRTNEADLCAEVPEESQVPPFGAVQGQRSECSPSVTSGGHSPLLSVQSKFLTSPTAGEGLPESPYMFEGAVETEPQFSVGEPATPVKSEGVGEAFVTDSPISVQSSLPPSEESAGHSACASIDEVDPDDGTSAAGDTSSEESSEESSDDSSSVARPVPRLLHPPAPPAGTYFVQHSKLKTLHLLLDGHRAFTLCGRSLQQEQNPFGPPGSLRYDTPVCKQCRRATANLLD